MLFVSAPWSGLEERPWFGAPVFFCAQPLAVARERTWLVAPLFFGNIVLNTGATFIL